MRDWNGRSHTWPRKSPTERRIHPRVRISFPIRLQPEDHDADPVPAVVQDVSVGGLRVLVPRFFELFDRVEADFEVPLTDRHGVQGMHSVRGTMAVVRIEPEDPQTDHAVEYEASLEFAGADAERERILGLFMLQTLLFDPKAQLT